MVHDDKIIAVVTYEVGGHVVDQKTYTWTVKIPTPELINAQYNQGEVNRGFDDERFDYILTLPTGATSTDTTITKTEGDLNLKIVHESVVAGETVTICDACDFDTVRALHTRAVCVGPSALPV